MTLDDESRREAIRFGDPHAIRHHDRDYNVLHFHDPRHGGALLAVFDQESKTRVTPWFAPPFCDRVAATIGDVSVSYEVPVTAVTYRPAEVRAQPRSAGRAQTVKSA